MPAPPAPSSYIRGHPVMYFRKGLGIYPYKTYHYIPEEHGVRFVDVPVDPHHVLLKVSPGGVLPLGTEQGSCSLWTTHYHRPAIAYTYIMIEYRLITNHVDTS